MGSDNHASASTRPFYGQLFALVLPIAAQSLISALVNSAGVVILGYVSQAAISAVSLANQVTFMLMLFYLGISTGTGILTAQYWGKGDISSIERVQGIGCCLSAIVSAFFFVAALLVPESLMRILTNDEVLVALGARYLRVLSVSYLFMSLSQVYLSVIRSMEQARLSAIISSVCLAVQVALSSLAVFVLFPGDSDRATTGVAAVTVVARAVELVWCLLHSALKGRAKLRLAASVRLDRPLLRDFLRYASPVQANYLVWGGALSATAVIMGHVSSDMVAANSVASAVKNLVLVLCTGIAQGGSVLIGKSLGEGLIEDAKRDGGRVVRCALAAGALAGFLILIFRPLALKVGSLSDDAQSILNGMLLICSVYCIGKSANSTVIGGIFCAGGDSKFGFLCDTVVMWGIVIPAGYLSAFVLRLPPVAVYAVLCTDEFLKLPFMVRHYRQYKWLNNITRQHMELEALA